MQTGIKQVFYFNAGATSAGGYLENPFRPIPTPCSVSLSPTGGEALAKSDEPCQDKVLSYKSAYTFVTGKPVEINGPWTHRVVSVVEGFNLLNRVKASTLIAQAFIEHPKQAPKGAPMAKRKISFAGTRFEGLEIDGKTITPTINAGFFAPNEAPVDHYDTAAWTEPSIEWQQLSAIAKRQGAVLQGQSLPDWVKARYSWVADPKTSVDYTICSLVDSIPGLSDEPTPGHCFELPELGRVFLGEVMVHPSAISLTMVRAELGCNTSGQASGGTIVSNGESCPPSYSDN